MVGCGMIRALRRTGGARGPRVGRVPRQHGQAPADARVSSGGERSEGSRRSETTQWAGARAGAGFRGGLAQMGRRRMKRRTRGAGCWWMLGRAGRVAGKEGGRVWWWFTRG